MNKFVCVIVAVLGLVITNSAYAQPSTPGTDPPKCEDVPSCKKALEECQSDLETSKKSAADLQTKLDVCEGKLTPAIKTIPKPTQLVCEGDGIRPNGRGGCECIEPDGQGGFIPSKEAVLVVKSNFARACVAPYESFRLLRMDVEALKKLGLRVDELEKRVNALYAIIGDPGAFKTSYDQLLKDVVDLQQRVALLEQWRPQVDAKLDDHEKRISDLEGQDQNLWNSGLDAGIGAMFLPGAGPMGYFSLEWVNKFYPSKDVPVGFQVKAGGGRGFANDSMGGNWLLTAEAGALFNVYRRFVEIDVGVTGKQCISDHGAGYQGVLEDPGICTFFGGKAGVNINPVRYFDVGLDGGVGYSNTNYFEGPGDLRLDDGVAGFIGLHIGFNTGVVE